MRLPFRNMRCCTRTQLTVAPPGPAPSASYCNIRFVNLSGGQVAHDRMKQDTCPQYALLAHVDRSLVRAPPAVPQLVKVGSL